LTLLFATPATADCLSGPGSIGFEAGTQTYGVTLPNRSPVTQIEGVVCGPNSGVVDPDVSAAGAGINPTFADPLLEVHFPIEDLPGVYAPYPGSDPLFPLEVPGLSNWMLSVLGLTLLYTAGTLGGRLRSYRR